MTALSLYRSPRELSSPRDLHNLQQLVVLVVFYCSHMPMSHQRCGVWSSCIDCCCCIVSISYTADCASVLADRRSLSPLSLSLHCNGFIVFLSACPSQVESIQFATTTTTQPLHHHCGRLSLSTLSKSISWCFLLFSLSFSSPPSLSPSLPPNWQSCKKAKRKLA